MDTTQSTAKPWTKVGFGYAFVFKAIPVPEDKKLVDDETKEPNKELFDEMLPVLLSSPSVFQVFFYKEGESLQINDIYKCVLRGYQDTSSKAELNENLGLVLDSLRILGMANKNIKNEMPVPSILSSFVDTILEESSLFLGSIVNTESHLCFLKLDKMTVMFLPSSSPLATEQDEKK
jgi:hypothetical protein